MCMRVLVIITLASILVPLVFIIIVVIIRSSASPPSSSTSGPIYTAKKSCRLRKLSCVWCHFLVLLVTCQQKVGKVKKKNELRGRFFPPQFVLLISTLLCGRIAFDSVRLAAVAASRVGVVTLQRFPRWRNLRENAFCSKAKGPLKRQSTAC